MNTAVIVDSSLSMRKDWVWIDSMANLLNADYRVFKSEPNNIADLGSDVLKNVVGYDNLILISDGWFAEKYVNKVIKELVNFKSCKFICVDSSESQLNNEKFNQAFQDYGTVIIVNPSIEASVFAKTL